MVAVSLRFRGQLYATLLVYSPLLWKSKIEDPTSKFRVHAHVKLELSK